MKDSAVLMANLHTGNIDLAERVLPSDVAEVKKDPKLRIVSAPSLWYGGITFNLAHGERSKAPIGQSALLRQAFEAAIDRKALSDVVFNGLYVPTIQAVPPSSPFYVPGFEAPPRDLAKAIALVKESGVPTPIVVSMNVPNTPDNTQTAEVIQSMVRDAGFDLKINTIEFASSLAAASQGDFESFLIGWSGRADPDGNLYVFLHSGAAQNDGRYANPIVDAALDTARTLTDVAARREQYTILLQQERKDLPIIYLNHPVNIVGMSAKITGFRSVPDGMIRLQGLSVTK
jgi:peptide/nickel transport system substrate-binding protein